MRIANEVLIPELARLLSEGKEVRFTPSGVSMRPFIEGDKDSVILAPFMRAPRRGDIVLAHACAAGGVKTYVLHRLVRIENNQSPIADHQSPIYILQGDGNLTGEETCAREDLIGRVIAVETPDGRRKCLTRGFLWYRLRPMRHYLLKIYRHSWLKWKYKS